MGDQKYKKKHRELGLCRDCSDPATHGTRCKKHTIMHCKSMIKTRKKRIKNFKCNRCGLPLFKDTDFGRISCVNCRSLLQRNLLEGVWN